MFEEEEEEEEEMFAYIRKSLVNLANSIDIIGLSRVE